MEEIFQGLTLFEMAVIAFLFIIILLINKGVKNQVQISRNQNDIFNAIVNLKEEN